MIIDAWQHFDEQTKEIFGRKDFFSSPFILKDLLPGQDKRAELLMYTTSTKGIQTYALPWQRSFDLYLKSKTVNLPEAYISNIRIAPNVTGKISEQITYIAMASLPSMVGEKLISIYPRGNVHSTGHVVKRLLDDRPAKLIHCDSALNGQLRITDMEGREETYIPIGDEEAEEWPTMIRIMDHFENFIAMNTYNEDIYIGWSCKPTYVELTFFEPDVPKLHMDGIEKLLASQLRHFGTLFMAQYVNQIESLK